MVTAVGKYGFPILHVFQYNGQLANGQPQRVSTRSLSDLDINLLQIRQIGPDSHGFSLNSAAIRLKSMKIWSQFLKFSLRFSKSDRLLACHNQSQ